MVSPTITAELQSGTPHPVATPTLHPDIRKCMVQQEQNIAGIIIRVEEVCVAPCPIFVEAASEESGQEAEAFWSRKGVQTIAALKLQVENTTERTIYVHPDAGIVVVGSEQIHLSDYLYPSDDVGGLFFSGVMKEGVVCFGIKRTAANQVTSLRFVVDPPLDENYNRLADTKYDFRITLK